MKVYSIGREAGCDIVISDSTDVISRRHAVLNVMPSGKMTIVDQSHNGTYVNGIRIAPNVPVPVTRKDNISLAHVARLDWNRVPKPAGAMPYIIAAIVVVVLAVAGVVGYHWGASLFNTKPAGGNPVIAVGDTTKTGEDKEKKEEKKDAKKDSATEKKQVTAQPRKQQPAHRQAPAQEKKKAPADTKSEKSTEKKEKAAPKEGSRGDY